MGSLALNYEGLYNEIGRFLGWEFPTDRQLEIVKDIITRGIRQFLYPVNLTTGQAHEWEFLKVFWDFTTTAGQWKYALPVDFSDLYSTLYFDVNNANPPLVKRSAEQILSMRTGGTISGFPEYFAITPLRYDTEIGSLYELWIYPTPSNTETLSGFYRADPVQLSATNNLVVGGIRAIEAVLESCLSVAEIQEDGAAGIHTQLAGSLIQKLIVGDTVTATDKIGNLYYDKDRVWPPLRGESTYPNMDNVYP